MSENNLSTMNDIAVRIECLGKMYRLYGNPFDRVVDALGFGRLLFWKQERYREFWALRDISLTVRRGERIGIIGRNGAGKSTLLKTICGNLQPTEGACEVKGRVQALLEMGTGFHPEFTGRQNIQASLAYQGLSAAAIRAAEEDIIEFAEIDAFIDQPVKTYSAGMYARLAFSVVTAIQPDLLIIDEVLGAGDAYFATKCAARMKELVESRGATVLLVSHATDQILRYCDQCLWLERGKIVQQGPSMDVVKAYLEFVHGLEEQKLKAKNRKRSQQASGYETLTSYSDTLAVSFHVFGPRRAETDVAAVTLLHDGLAEETLEVGGIQDADLAHPTRVVLEGSNWSEPRREEGVYHRRLALREGKDSSTHGYVAFLSYGLKPRGEYSLRIRYRHRGEPKLLLTVQLNGRLLGEQLALAATGDEWVETTVPVVGLRDEAEPLPALAPAGSNGSAKSKGSPVARLPGEGSLLIEQAVLLDSDRRERTVFKPDDDLSLRMTVRATKDGEFSLVPTATLFRLDGVPVSNFIGPCQPLALRKDQTQEFQLDLGPLMLGDGDFTFSLALFDRVVDADRRYDLLAYSYEFKVVGNDSAHNWLVVRHPSNWKTLVPVRKTAGPERTTVDQYWSEHTVRSTPFKTVQESLDYLEWRFAEYPLFRELMGLWGEHDGEVVLDYGCGPGNDLAGFVAHTRAAKVIGMDVSEKALELARQRLALHGAPRERVELVQVGDSRACIPLDDASVDFIYCEGVLHHTSDPEQLLREFFRVLKPRGTANIMVYNRDSVWLHLYTAYVKMVLEDAAAGLTLDEAFQRTTDGADCPIARCYAAEEFLSIAARAGFPGEYAGGYLSKHELAMMAVHRQQAVEDQRLPAEHRRFLAELTSDARGLPLHQGKHAGIGGAYRLRKP